MKKPIAFALLLGIGVTAQAAPVRTLDFNDSGCVEAPFNVQRGSTYRFQHTHSQPLSLTIQPATPASSSKTRKAGGLLCAPFPTKPPAPQRP